MEFQPLSSGGSYDGVGPGPSTGECVCVLSQQFLVCELCRAPSHARGGQELGEEPDTQERVEDPKRH